MDYQDVELHDQFRRDLELQKEWVQDQMDKENRYHAHYKVLDTDYKDYLIMYKCREEKRMATTKDDVNPIQEDYRAIIEEFDDKRHPQLLANKTISMAGPNTDFKEL